MSVSWCPQARQATYFDDHQFQNRGHYLKGAPLAWSDMAHLHLQKTSDRKPGRKKATPLWSLQNEKLREVILVYLENRLCVRDSSGTYADRLARSRAKALADLPSKQQRLQTWVTEYRGLVHSLKKADAAKAKTLQQLIQGLDSEIAILPKLPEVVSSVAFLFHRVLWNSTSVAESLNICAPAVRQLLFRMNKVGKKLWPETGSACEPSATQHEVSYRRSES
jgi:hypothetical protein